MTVLAAHVGGRPARRQFGEVSHCQHLDGAASHVFSRHWSVSYLQWPIGSRRRLRIKAPQLGNLGAPPGSGIEDARAPYPLDDRRISW